MRCIGVVGWKRGRTCELGFDFEEVRPVGLLTDVRLVDGNELVADRKEKVALRVHKLYTPPWRSACFPPHSAAPVSLTLLIRKRKTLPLTPQYIHAIRVLDSEIVSTERERRLFHHEHRRDGNAELRV